MSREVPCNGCQACCHGERIILHPEHGDDVASYETEVISHPFTRVEVHVIRPRDDGTSACRYLGETGCTIYDRRPVICRGFDCRRLYLKFDRNTRRRMIANSMADAAIFKAGRERLSSLPPHTVSRST